MHDQASFTDVCQTWTRLPASSYSGDPVFRVFIVVAHVADDATSHLDGNDRQRVKRGDRVCVHPFRGTVDGFRHPLVSRVEIETRAFHNPDHLTGDIRRSRVLAYLEVGVRLSYWSERTSSRASYSIRCGHSRGVPRMLLRG